MTSKLFNINEKDEQKIVETLRKKDFDGEYEGPESINDVTSIIVTGDWKHQHGWLDAILKDLGYRVLGELIMGDNSSDWYTSKHYYTKVNNPRLKFSIPTFERQLKKREEELAQKIESGEITITLVNPENAQ